VSNQRPPGDPDADDRHDHEVPLPGGIANRGKVVRIGDTVHRPRRDTSAATHALLHHLERVGFDVRVVWRRGAFAVISGASRR